MSRLGTTVTLWSIDVVEPGLEAIVDRSFSVLMFFFPARFGPDLLLKATVDGSFSVLMFFFFPAATGPRLLLVAWLF